jgi:hypothetical protein
MRSTSENGGDRDETHITAFSTRLGENQWRKLIIIWKDAEEVQKAIVDLKSQPPPLQ